MAKNEERKTDAQQHRLCGVVEEAATRSRERREARRDKPQSWLQLKLGIMLTICLLAYTTYVFIGRLCVPMIRRDEGSFGSRGLGIAFLVVDCVLELMVLWTYMKVCVVSPGKARDYVKTSPAPEDHIATPPWWDAESDLGGESYEPPPEPKQRTKSDQKKDATPAQKSPPNSSADIEGTKQEAKKDDNAGVTDGIPPIAAARAAKDPRADPDAVSGSSTNAPTPQKLPMKYTRRPPSTPVLLPECRYCYKDKFIRPYRAHHCRACGTCILKYDHHCPWIGQCVGAHNHKFFVNFLEWGLIFCLWTFATLLAENIKARNRTNASPDPQEIAIIALSGLFGLFTYTLLMTHINSVLLNVTTVEALSARAIKEREKRVLARLHPWYAFRARRQTKKEWDAEWGRIGREGNLWYLGSIRQNWESVMGHRIYEWFLPVGRSPVDGMSYMPNPRFDAEGRWRPRKEWPEELR